MLGWCYMFSTDQKPCLLVTNHLKIGEPWLQRLLEQPSKRKSLAQVFCTTKNGRNPRLQHPHPVVSLSWLPCEPNFAGFGAHISWENSVPSLASTDTAGRLSTCGPGEIQATLSVFPVAYYTNNDWLVVRTLWKIWLRQWEGWHPIYYGKYKMFQTTNQMKFHNSSGVIYTLDIDLWKKKNIKKKNIPLQETWFQSSRVLDLLLKMHLLSQRWKPQWTFLGPFSCQVIGGLFLWYPDICWLSFGNTLWL